MGKLSDYQNKGQEGVSEKDIRAKYDEYKNMDQNQLSNELMKEVGRQKMAGTFDFERLESMVEGLKGSLPEENYHNIKRILDGLK